MKMVLIILMFNISFLEAVNGNCEFERQKNMILDIHQPDEIKHLVYWDFLSREILERNEFKNLSMIISHRNRVKEKINIDPYFLLERYIPKVRFKNDLHNLNLILSENFGTIGPIGCIESLLLNYQISRSHDFENNPTEFLAYYLVKNEKLRVYFFTNDAGGIRKMGRLYKEIEKDLNLGWSVAGNLHNHTFSLNKLKENISQGVLAPSASDLGAYKGHTKISLPYVYITNGFHTLKLKQESFSFFKSHED